MNSLAMVLAVANIYGASTWIIGYVDRYTGAVICALGAGARFTRPLVNISSVMKSTVGLLERNVDLSDPTCFDPTTPTSMMIVGPDIV